MEGDDGSENRDGSRRNSTQRGAVGRGQRRWSTPEGASTLAGGGAANMNQCDETSQFKTQSMKFCFTLAGKGSGAIRRCVSEKDRDAVPTQSRVPSGASSEVGGRLQGTIGPRHSISHNDKMTSGTVKERWQSSLHFPAPEEEGALAGTLQRAPSLSSEENRASSQKPQLSTSDDASSLGEMPLIPSLDRGGDETSVRLSRTSESGCLGPARMPIIPKIKRTKSEMENLKRDNAIRRLEKLCTRCPAEGRNAEDLVKICALMLHLLPQSMQHYNFDTLRQFACFSWAERHGTEDVIFSSEKAGERLVYLADGEVAIATADDSGGRCEVSRLLSDSTAVLFALFAVGSTCFL